MSLHLQDLAAEFFHQHLEPELRRAGTSEQAIRLARGRIIASALEREPHTLELLKEYL